MSVLVFIVLSLHCAFGASVLKQDVMDNTDLSISPRAAYGRDFDQLFYWWKTNDGKKTETVQERLKKLETRQNALYDWLRCESYDNQDCASFRTKAENTFGTPSKSTSATTMKTSNELTTQKSEVSTTPASQESTTTAVPTTTAAVSSSTTIATTTDTTEITN